MICKIDNFLSTHKQVYYKPVDGTGMHGHLTFSSMDEIIPFLNSYISKQGHKDYGNRYAIDFPFILMEVLEGIPFSIDATYIDGTLAFAMTRCPKKDGVFGSVISDAQVFFDDEDFLIAEMIGGVIPMGTSQVCIDGMVTSDGKVPLEINSRPGGGSPVTWHAYNPFEIFIGHDQGKSIDEILGALEVTEGEGDMWDTYFTPKRTYRASEILQEAPVVGR